MKQMILKSKQLISAGIVHLKLALHLVEVNSVCSTSTSSTFSLRNCLHQLPSSKEIFTSPQSLPIGLRIGQSNYMCFGRIADVDLCIGKTLGSLDFENVVQYRIGLVQFVWRCNRTHRQKIEGGLREVPVKLGFSFSMKSQNAFSANSLEAQYPFQPSVTSSRGIGFQLSSVWAPESGYK
jgi:hypothetical protein